MWNLLKLIAALMMALPATATTTGGEYPHQALEGCVEGWAYLELEVLEDGSIGAVYVLAAEPQGFFEANAMEAARHLHFEPRLSAGKPIAYRMPWLMTFEIEGNDDCDSTKGNVP